jgi:alpha-tubulin suppressor-like RCC1 family protein
VVQVETGSFHTCAVLSTRELYCWGANDFGQLGDPDFTQSWTPIGPILTGVTALATGSNHTCAVTGDALRCWGENASGQVGDGTCSLQVASPTIVLPSGVADVAAGEVHTCAELTGGGASCWGYGTYGRLGYANEDRRCAPGEILPGELELVLVADAGELIESIDAGLDFNCVLLDNGRVRCWGSGVNGRLGYGNTFNIGDGEDPADAGDVPLVLY